MLLEADGAPRQLTLMATGSELHLAAEARTVLQVEGVPTAVVSVPCAFIFNEQDLDYQRAVLCARGGRGGGADELGQVSRLRRSFVGMHGFGESGKIADVYRKFDITAEAVV